MNIEFIVMENSEENAKYVESMRMRAYENKPKVSKIAEEYLEDILNGSILVFMCLIDCIPVSACYISDYKGILYVDYLFTIPEYQGKKLYYGKQLLQYILDNKEIVEEYFKHHFSRSELSPETNQVAPIYESLGYKRKRKDFGTMYKPI